jgi:hypothetical protein
LFAGALALSTLEAAGGRTSMLRGLLVMYTLAATISSAAISVRHGWRFFPTLPIAFACLHLSYGLGSIAGLIGLAGRSLVRAGNSDARESTEAPR